jgi:hypothetical protein
MQTLRLNKIAERVILLQTGASGGVTPVTLFKKKRKKSNSSFTRRPGSMVMDRMRDIGGNVFKAMDSARKNLGVDRLPF